MGHQETKLVLLGVGQCHCAGGCWPLLRVPKAVCSYRLVLQAPMLPVLHIVQHGNVWVAHLGAL